ncbi:MAG: DUF2087 domain-containing protein [Clostridiales bacterium]|nr:DUF2087 domain-containing protein [Clostridiales bacterium]
MKDIFSNSLNEIENGFAYNAKAKRFECLLCDTYFEEGEIFNIDGRLFNSERAAYEHIKNGHNGVLDHLLDLDKKYIGLTEKQKSLLKDIAKGLTDKEISEKNGIATATVRHQKFVLREKAKQAKLYMAIYETVENATLLDNSNVLVSTHIGAKMVDERYVLTVEEEKKIIENYFEDGENLKLKNFPSKEKKKIVVLRRITQVFDNNKKYSELELNDIIGPIHDDIATIRRYLIQYGFMDRTKNGSQYWVKK